MTLNTITLLISIPVAILCAIEFGRWLRHEIATVRKIRELHDDADMWS